MEAPKVFQCELRAVTDQQPPSLGINAEQAGTRISLSETLPRLRSRVLLLHHQGEESPLGAFVSCETPSCAV